MIPSSAGRAMRRGCGGPQIRPGPRCAPSFCTPCRTCQMPRVSSMLARRRPTRQHDGSGGSSGSGSACSCLPRQARPAAARLPRRLRHQARHGHHGSCGAELRLCSSRGGRRRGAAQPGAPPRRFHQPAAAQLRRAGGSGLGRAVPRAAGGQRGGGGAGWAGGRRRRRAAGGGEACSHQGVPRLGALPLRGRAAGGAAGAPARGAHAGGAHAAARCAAGRGANPTERRQVQAAGRRAARSRLRVLLRRLLPCTHPTLPTHRLQPGAAARGRHRRGRAAGGRLAAQLVCPAAPGRAAGRRAGGAAQPGLCAPRHQARQREQVFVWLFFLVVSCGAAQNRASGQQEARQATWRLLALWLLTTAGDHARLAASAALAADPPPLPCCFPGAAQRGPRPRPPGRPGPGGGGGGAVGEGAGQLQALGRLPPPAPGALEGGGEEGQPLVCWIIC